MQKHPRDYLIVALDTSNDKEAIKFVEELKDYTGYFKVGLELFTNSGPKIIDIIKDQGCKVFFDGKFLDIPNTVSKAVSNMVKHRVDMLNVYMSGGQEMLLKAKETLVETAMQLNLQAPKLLGVTVLTSITSDVLEKDLKIQTQIDEYVLHLARLAVNSNLDGIICSPNEVKLIREGITKSSELRPQTSEKEILSSKDFLIVTPGVRPSWSENHDQKRTATPKEAIKNGANHILVGRPITRAKAPKDAAKKVLEEIEEALVMLHTK